MTSTVAPIAPTTSLGDLVRERPSAAPVLERLHLDFCCGGGQTLAHACAERGLDAATVIAMLDALDASAAAGAGVPGTAHDVRHLSIAELCDHVVGVHHEAARAAMPRVAELLDTVVRVHGDEQPDLHELRRVFTAMRADLDVHFALEEQTLFPACRRAATGDLPPELSDEVLAMCQDAHTVTGDGLATLSELTHRYDLERARCNTHRMLLDALHGFEVDMHQHVHEENNVLFPRVRELLAAAG